MTANLSFLRARGSGIGGMTITESFCGGCGASIVNANTACERLCRECRKLDDQQLVTRMSQAVTALGQLQPLAKLAAAEWRDYNDDMALSFIEALDALADFFGEDVP